MILADDIFIMTDLGIDDIESHAAEFSLSSRQYLVQFVTTDEFESSIESIF